VEARSPPTVGRGESQSAVASVGWELCECYQQHDDKQTEEDQKCSACKLTIGFVVLKSVKQEALVLASSQAF
jgi:hypothetical protein